MERNSIELSRVDEIVSLHNEIIGHLSMSLDKAIRIGEILTEQKVNFKHGEFIPWVLANLPFTDRTARNYMRCYRERAKLKMETVSDLKSAYKLLAEPKPIIKCKNIESLIAEREIALKKAHDAAELVFDYDAQIGKTMEHNPDESLSGLSQELEECHKRIKQLQKEIREVCTETKEDWIKTGELLSSILRIVKRNRSLAFQAFTKKYGKSRFKAMIGAEHYELMSSN